MAYAEETKSSNLSTPVVCDECGGQNDVMNLCLQCPANICDRCKSIHCNRTLTRDHNIVVSNCAGTILSETPTRVQPDTTQKVNLDYTANATVLKTIDDIRDCSVLNHNRDQAWICDDNNKRIRIYNEQFTKIKTIMLSYRCYDMATYSSRSVIATDWDNHRIVRISSSGGITTLFSTDPLLPCGICVNNKQQIVVGVLSLLSSYAWKLVVYSCDGSSILQDIEYDQSGEPLFTGTIRRVRQTVSGEYVIVGDSRILCLGTDWKIKWTYKFESEYNVMALHCDIKNNILVGNKQNKEIMMFNKKGQLIRRFLTERDGIYRPLSLDVDSKGRLWIGQTENILILTYMT